jgi:organic hydroperoxide reductase OsmC/OhrA
MPIIRSTEVNQQTAYDVQHWSCCVRLAEKRQVRVNLLGVKRRLKIKIKKLKSQKISDLMCTAAETCSYAYN